MASVFAFRAPWICLKWLRIFYHQIANAYGSTPFVYCRGFSPVYETAFLVVELYGRVPQYQLVFFGTSPKDVCTLTSLPATAPTGPVKF